MTDGSSNLIISETAGLRSASRKQQFCAWKLLVEIHEDQPDWADKEAVSTQIGTLYNDGEQQSSVSSLWGPCPLPSAKNRNLRLHRILTNTGPFFLIFHVLSMKCSCSVSVVFDPTSWSQNCDKKLWTHGRTPLYYYMVALCGENVHLDDCVKVRLSLCALMHVWPAGLRQPHSWWVSLCFLAHCRSPLCSHKTFNLIHPYCRVLLT